MLNSSLDQILSGEPAYRLKQIYQAWFDFSLNGYDEITTLPASLREKMKSIPWLCLAPKRELKSGVDNTRKFLFALADGECVETVLMGRENLKEEAENDGERYTICVSTQVGCPMGCTFCATGRGGFKRNLEMTEIVDQVRYCGKILALEGDRVANIVVMGQGEPLLNYDNLKTALKIILDNTDIGPRKITVSTCGVPAAMERLLTDKDFPLVRWAVSLHSAIVETRSKIMPIQQKDFLEFLVKWAKDYHRVVPSRSHFIGLEYIMLHGVNDDERHLKALIKLARKMPRIRINLIPYNSDTTGIPPLLGEGQGAGYVARPSPNTPTSVLPLRGGGNRNFARTPAQTIEHWHEALMKEGFVSTIRRSQGQDIAAACGQLRNAV